MVGFNCFVGELTNANKLKNLLENYDKPVEKEYGEQKYKLDEKTWDFKQEGQRTIFNLSIDAKRPTTYHGQTTYYDMTVNAHVRIISSKGKNYFLIHSSDNRYLGYITRKLSEIIYNDTFGINEVDFSDTLIRKVKEEDRRSQGVMWVEGVTQKDHAIGLFGNLEYVDGDTLEESEYNKRLKDKTIRTTQFQSFSTDRTIWISGKKNKLTVAGGNYTEVEEYFTKMILPKL